MKAGMKVTRDSWKGNFFNGKNSLFLLGKNKGMTTKALIPIPPSGDEFADCIMCYTKKRIFNQIGHRHRKICLRKIGKHTRIKTSH